MICTSDYGFEIMLKAFSEVIQNGNINLFFNSVPEHKNLSINKFRMCEKFQKPHNEGLKLQKTTSGVRIIYPTFVWETKDCDWLKKTIYGYCVYVDTRVLFYGLFKTPVCVETTSDDIRIDFRILYKACESE